MMQGGGSTPTDADSERIVQAAAHIGFIRFCLVTVVVFQHLLDPA